MEAAEITADAAVDVVDVVDAVDSATAILNVIVTGILNVTATGTGTETETATAILNVTASVSVIVTNVEKKEEEHSALASEQVVMILGATAVGVIVMMNLKMIFANRNIEAGACIRFRPPLLHIYPAAGFPLPG